MKYSKTRAIIAMILLFCSYFPYLGIPYLSGVMQDYYLPIYVIGCIILLLLFSKSTHMAIKKKQLALLFAAILFCIVCYVINDISYGNMITIICTMVFLYIFSESIIDKNGKKIILALSLLVTTILVVTSFSVVKKFYSGLSILNPNALAQLLLLCLITISQLTNNNKIRIFFSIIIIVGIFNCESRTILVISLLYTVYVLIKKIFNNKLDKKRIRALYILVVALGIIIPLIYVFLYTNSYSISTSLFEKNIYSGRERIWAVVLNEIKRPRNMLTGVPTVTYSDKVYTLNMHNIYITILANYGILFFIIFYRNIYQKIASIHNDNTYCITIGILAILLAGTFENILFSMEINYIICFLFSLKTKNMINMDENKQLLQI